MFLRLSGIAAAGTVLAACTQVAAPTAGEAAPAAAGGELSLLMVDWNDNSRTVYESDVLPAFTEATGWTVLPDWTSWGDLDTKVMTAFASGLQPDIFQADNVEFGPKYHERGILAELDDLVAASSSATEKLSDFYTKAIEEGSKNSGKLVAIPYILDNRACFYRKDLLEEAGIDATQAFASWDGFREAAIAQTVRDGETFTRAGWWSNLGQFCMQTYLQYLWQNGGNLLNETEDAVAFNSEQGIEALAFWTSLIREDMVGPAEEIPNVGDLNPFTAESVAMFFSGYGTLLNVQTYAPDMFENVGVVVLANEQPASLWYANTFFLSKKDNVDTAWQLLEHLVFDDDNFLKYHEAQGGLPPRKSIVESASFITPLHLVLIDDVMNAAGSHTSPPVPFSLEVLDRISEMCQKAVFGQATPEEAIAVAADEATQIIERYRSGS
jgi:multiple sugar transport system substrate-binding protein